MSGIQPEAKGNGGSSNRLGLFLTILFAVLLCLFHKSLEPNQYLFANDAPMGAMKAADNAFPAAFTGRWMDLNWLGFEIPSAAPNMSGAVATIISPELCFKVFAPLSLFVLGFSVWLFFRQLKFNSMVCVLGGLAAGLNMHFLSIACWGLGTWTLASASMFFAMAAMVSPAIRFLWARAALAGLGVGMGVMEGFDIGAILSLYAGVFVVFVVWSEGGSVGKKVFRTVWVPTLVVIFSMLVAAHTVASLIGTQIKGIVGASQDQESKAAGWNFATQWSLPKLEFFRVLIPGVFGYRLEAYIHDTDRSSSYWGRVGEDPNIPLLNSSNPEVLRSVSKSLGLRPDFEAALTGSDPQLRAQAVGMLKSSLQRRHSGSGEYAGILVGVLALFGIANSLRRTNSPFTQNERRAMLFWGIVAIVSLFLAFGRHAFLYQFFYQLPYFSTIRNPIKFMYPFHIAWIILAGYGLEALHRRYLKNAPQRTVGLLEHVKVWWRRTAGFDKKWAIASLLAVGVTVLVTLIFVSARMDLERYLQNAGFPPGPPAPGVPQNTSGQIADFFYGELFWFIVYLSASVGVIICILSGAWNGRRTKWAWIALGTILVLDLGRSDWRWVEYYDFNQRYSSNPVLDFLKEKPYENRLTAELMPLTRQAMTTTPNFFTVYYDILQNQIPFLNIQTLDIIQMPRTPEFDKAYINAFRPRTNLFPCLRLWQLTNTRYVLGSTNNTFGLKFSPEEGFQSKLSFNIAPKPGVTLLYGGEDLTFEQTKDGPLALYELTNVLPRAKLYSHWEPATTNEQATLEKLASSAFDPTKTVIVAADTPTPASPTEPNVDAGSVTITSYQPKNIKLQASAKTASVMLFNDRTAPQWKAWVDGKPTEVLRCNYIMRGVYLPKGEHTIEFRFQPSLNTLYVSLGAWGAGILIAGFLVFSNRMEKRNETPAGKPVEETKKPVS